jgi:stage IV sporulation protein B
MKKRLKVLNYILSPLVVLLFFMYSKIGNIPNTIFVRQGENPQLSKFIKFDHESINYDFGNLSNNDKKINVNLLGFLPIKSVCVKSVPDIEVYPGGQPVGIKLKTKGVLVVGLSDISSTEGKKLSPGAAAGIQIGDSILKINNKNIDSVNDISKIVNEEKNNKISILIERKGKLTEKNIVPVKSSKDDKFKIGLWVRDSTAGVGTLTFYDGKSGKFAALGHPITDIDTGKILSVKEGEIVSSDILSVKRGIKGEPGELKGIFVDENVQLGNISKNTECGIFGKCQGDLRNKKFNKPMKIALRNEIKVGAAKILTTVDGKEPKMYDIQIEKLLNQDTPGPKSMVIKVTDKKLLDKTGGIVQGMSGSPIIQNNKLIGAVTHVLINKPEVGYGIYIEWMIKDAEILSK